MTVNVFVGNARWRIGRKYHRAGFREQLRTLVGTVEHARNDAFAVPDQHVTRLDLDRFSADAQVSLAGSGDVGNQRRANGLQVMTGGQQPGLQLRGKHRGYQGIARRERTPSKRYRFQLKEDMIGLAETSIVCDVRPELG